MPAPLARERARALDQRVEERRAARARPPRPPRAGAATVRSSPRATGPVSARSGPSSAQFSTVRAHQRGQQLPRLAGLEPGAGGHALGGVLERRPGSSRRSRRPRGRRRGRRRRSRTAPCRAPCARPRATSSASGVEPAIAQPHPRSPRPSGPAKVWSGCSPNAAAPAGSSAASGVAPLVWPTKRAAPATALAAAPISASGTHSSRTPAAVRHLAAASGPVDRQAGARSAAARAVPRRPAPTTPTGACDRCVRARLVIRLPVHSLRGSGRQSKDTLDCVVRRA